MKWRLMLLATGLLACASCANELAQRRPYLILENMDYAARHLARGQKEEAAQLYQVVLLADPTNEKARAALAGIGEYDRCIMEPTWLGLNYECGPLRHSFALRVVLYPINRILDILDIFSFHVGLEGGAFVDAHVTHALQVAGGAGGGLQFGWWQKRDLAIGTGEVAGVALGPVSAMGEDTTRIGTGGIGDRSFTITGVSHPTDIEYQRYRDYWGIGARVIAGVVGAEFEIHPIEIAHAVTGFFFIDFLHDDLFRTRALDLNRAERTAMENLIDTLTPTEMRARISGRLIAPAPPRSAPPETAQPSPAPTPAN